MPDDDTFQVTVEDVEEFAAQFRYDCNIDPRKLREAAQAINHLSDHVEQSSIKVAELALDWVRSYFAQATIWLITNDGVKLEISHDSGVIVRADLLNLLSEALKWDDFTPRYKCELDERANLQKALEEMLTIINSSLKDARNYVLADDVDNEKCWEHQGGEWRCRDLRPGEKTAASLR